MDLSFNSLQAIPSFSFSAKSTLNTLSVRYNNIVDLTGTSIYNTEYSSFNRYYIYIIGL